jgi:hypothetical protein
MRAQLQEGSYDSLPTSVASKIITISPNPRVQAVSEAQVLAAKKFADLQN